MPTLRRYVASVTAGFILQACAKPPAPTAADPMAAVIARGDSLALPGT